MKKSVVLGVALLAIGVRPAGAQTLPCAQLLTVSEILASAGVVFKNLGNESAAPGQSDCTWLREDGKNPKAIAFNFRELAAAPKGIPALFEEQATKAEGVHSNKREVLPGIGARAVLVPGAKPGAMFVLVIQTARGVAYVETDSLDRVQVLKLAKAIVTP